MAANEDEIYSTMFTSLKHPARRKVLRLLAAKPMTFMEMVETMGVSTSHLTYHLESLGELISKSEDGKYRLSSFGEATVGAMKSVEEVPEIQVKRRFGLPFRWKALFVGLLVCMLLLASLTTLAVLNLSQMASGQEALKQENEQLLAWGVGTNKVTSLLRDVAQIDVNSYKVSLLSNTVEYRSDIGAAEEVIRYSLTSGASNLDCYFRFRNNHFSRYQLNPIESTVTQTQTPPISILENAKAALDRYRAYSGDTYLDDMSGLFFSQITTKAEIVVGVDLTHNLLLKAKTQAKTFGNVHVIQADADHLPFKNGAFDNVFSFTVLQNMPKPKETLLEFKRQTKPDARIVVTGLKKAFELTSFLDLFDAAGLRMLNFVDDDELRCYIAVTAPS